MIHQRCVKASREIIFACRRILGVFEMFLTLNLLGSRCVTNSQ